MRILQLNVWARSGPYPTPMNRAIPAIEGRAFDARGHRTAAMGVQRDVRGLDAQAVYSD